MERLWLYKRPYFRSLLILPGLIDNSHQCLMNGSSYRPDKSLSRVVSTGKTSNQLRYEHGHDLGSYLAKNLRNNANATAGYRKLL